MWYCHNIRKEEMMCKHLIWKFRKRLSHYYFSIISTKAHVSFLETVFTQSPSLRGSLAWEGVGRKEVRNHFSQTYVYIFHVNANLNLSMTDKFITIQLIMKHDKKKILALPFYTLNVFSPSGINTSVFTNFLWVAVLNVQNISSSFD